MGEIKAYFYDTYALYEIVHGNKNYTPYMKDIIVITTRLNLMELHYRLLLLYGKNYADGAYDKFVSFTIDIGDEIIKRANELKSSLKSRKLSYVDCIGYIIAKMKNIKFLTGDIQFKDLENVEFVR